MIIEIKVKTKQQENSITRMEDGTYKISVKALPDKNKANIEVINLISKHFDIPKSQISIQTGQTSTKKRIILETA
jgi:uncharacterized protein YggU (UPF0235/DUF167 family)